MDCSMPGFPVLTISWSWLRFISIKSLMSFNYLTLCCSLLLPSNFLRIRVFCNVLALCITWPKYWRIFMLSLFSHSDVSNSLWPHELQHARLPCPSPSPRACLNPCPLSWWCHPIIPSSVIPFSSCLQSFPALWSFLMSRLFILGGSSLLELQPQHQSLQWIFRTNFL